MTRCRRSCLARRVLAFELAVADLVLADWSQGRAERCVLALLPCLLTRVECRRLGLSTFAEWHGGRTA